MSKPTWDYIYFGIERNEKKKITYIYLAFFGYGFQIRHRSMWGVIAQEYCTVRYNFWIGDWNLCFYGREL